MSINFNREILSRRLAGMEFKGKALFNLLRMNALEDPKMKLETWQIEDLRDLSEEELFERLDHLGIHMTRSNFELFAEDCDSPEELTQCLYDRDDAQLEEKIYLIVFELWRRICHDNQTISIFCDELDRLMLLYDRQELEDEEPLIEALKELENILDESVDEGLHDEEVLASISPYLAHDLETFLCDYILDQIETHNETYASELIDGFYDYIHDKTWFDFLRLNLLFATDVHEASLMADRLIEELREKPDLDLLFELLGFLVHVSETDLFLQAFILACHQIQSEKDFRDLIQVAIDYFNTLDYEEEERELADLLAKRTKGLDEPFDPSDVDFMHLNDLFIKKFESV